MSKCLHNFDWSNFSREVRCECGLTAGEYIKQLEWRNKHYRKTLLSAIRCLQENEDKDEVAIEILKEGKKEVKDES